MTNRIYQMIGLLALLWAAAACESLEETYDEYAGDGMVRYVGKCSDVEVNPGWERLQVVWKHSIDAGVKQVRIAWSSDAGGGETFAAPGELNSDDLMDTVYIENLGDAMYTVRVSNVASDGSESLVEEKYGRPYTESHEDLRTFSRGITAFSRMGGKLAVALAEDNENVKEARLVYTDTRGQEQEWDIKEHMDDTLSYLYWGYYDVKLGRDYMFLLPEGEGEIDFAKPIKIKRKGRLTGCIDEIDFADEELNLNERLWSTAFTQLLLGAYGPDWESRVDGIETLEIDYDMPTLQDLMYFPNLKKVILGKNRYMNSAYASADHSATDEYVGLTMLQFLKSTRPEFSVERYNSHFFYGRDDWGNPFLDAYKDAGKLTDLSIEEKGAANLDARPRYVPLDTAGWKATCSDADSVRDGYRDYGAAWLLYDEFRHVIEYYWPTYPDWGYEEYDKEMYFEPKQTLGASIVTVTFDMKANRKVEGFKVGQVASLTEDRDRNYLLSSLMIEFSEDGFAWSDATYTDGSATIGNSIGEETYIPVPEDLQVDARYIRVTMSNRPVDDVSGQGLYNLRLAKFIPCTVEEQ